MTYRVACALCCTLAIGCAGDDEPEEIGPTTEELESAANDFCVTRQMCGDTFPFADVAECVQQVLDDWRVSEAEDRCLQAQIARAECAANLTCPAFSLFEANPALSECVDEVTERGVHCPI